jgi:hypothetical protein
LELRLRLLKKAKYYSVLVFRSALYWKWWLRSYFPSRPALANDARLTVIVRTFPRQRLRNIGPLLRYLLACSFVEKVIVTNNNPAQRIAERFGGGRVVAIDQPVRQGAAIAWRLAGDEPADHFLVLDDDVLIYPSQVARLLSALVAAPAVPHGFAGRDANGFVSSREAEVVELHCAYAATRAHVRRYLDYSDRLEAAIGASPETAGVGDYVLISRAGGGLPRIHDIGFVAMCPTAEAPDVAVYRANDFSARRDQLRQALLRLIEEERGAASP